ncbi:hypothetical protein [Arthrobacter sp. ISL-5]|uniref:hypothetical protein n=1 Tax=Arthrobacter sp. ISL-5 TaxID=2819111 RepID=UPI001BE60812|nr:hypothetical protein [Arthrobacter sp. ISL-5]MBT2551586.1 hypothetical protein [Arthrobacter sp. ISL-5]
MDKHDSGTNQGSPATRQIVSGLRARPQARVLVIGGGINGVGTFRDLALPAVWA